MVEGITGAGDSATFRAAQTPNLPGSDVVSSLPEVVSVKRYGWQLGLTLVGALAVILASGAGRPVVGKAVGAVQTWRERRDAPVGRNVQHTVTYTLEEHKRDMGTVKTGVTDAGSVVSGTLSVLSATAYPILISGPVACLQASAGGATVCIEDISTTGWSGPDPQPSAPPGTELTYAAFINVGYATDPPYHFNSQAHEFVYVSGADDDDIVRDFSISITGRQLWRADSYAPGAGRENAPVYAKERTITDSWTTLDPLTVSVTFGSLSWSAELAAANPYITPINSVLLYADCHKGGADIMYAQVSNLAWSAASVDLSRYVFGTYNSGLYLDGKSGGFDLFYASTSRTTRSVTMGIPRIIDFSQVAIWDRAGALMGDVRLSGGFKASNHNPSSLLWSTTP